MKVGEQLTISACGLCLPAQLGKHLRRRFPAAVGAVEVAVEAHESQVMDLGSHVL